MTCVPFTVTSKKWNTWRIRTSPVISVNFTATAPNVSASLRVSYNGRIPPFQICTQGFDTVAVISG